MTCHLCLRDRKLVRSHIIPEAFWRELRDEDGPPVMISGMDGVFPKKSQIGVYDQTILCQGCEEQFQDVDDYGIRVLLKDFDRLFTPVYDTNFPPRVGGYVSDDIDQDRLLRFLVSVLWRASVSTQVVFRHVSLGELESQAAKVIDPKIPVPAAFGAVLARWTPAAQMGYATHGILDPLPMNIRGTPAYVVYFGQSIAYIRAGEMPFPDQLEVNRLGADGQVRVSLRDFERSSELKAMVHTANLSREREEQAAEARRRRKRNSPTPRRDIGTSST